MLKFKKALCFLCAGALCTSMIPHSAISAAAKELRTVEVSKAESVPVVQAGELLIGDANGDGLITDADVTALIAVIESGDLSGSEHMDVNGDTVIDDSDLALVTSYAAGEITYFPVGEIYAADVQFTTRAEWIHQLVTAFRMSVEDTSTITQYFTDIGDCAYADEIDLAANYGVFEVNGELFEPDAYVTREFAAHTLNYCMGFPSDVTCTYSDKNDVYYQGDAQISVTRGWFELVGNEFRPDLYMTAEESSVALADAETIAVSAEIDTEHEDSVVYRDGVIVFEESAEAVSSDNKVTISGSALTVSPGDNFVCYENGMAAAYKAVKVTENSDDSLTIGTEDPALEDIIESIDIEGYASLQEGGASVYGEGISVESSLVPIYGASAVIPISDISLNAMLPITDNVSVVLTGALSDIKIPITLKMQSLTSVEEFYAGVEASCEATAKLQGKLDLTESETIQIASIPVQGCGMANVNLVVSLVVTVSGEITVTYGFDFDAGVHYTSANGWRVAKNFQKKEFSVEVSADEKIAVKCGLDLNILGKSIGSAYVMAGEAGSYREKIQEDGVVCGSLKVYAFAEAGASVSLLGETFSKSYQFINWDNSPFKMLKHWEAYTPVSQCSYGDDDLDPSSGSYSGWAGYSGYGLLFTEQIPVTTIDTATVLTGDMTVENGLILNADLDLNGYTLTVNGDLTQNKGELYVHGGRADVNGTYAIEGGSLRMEDKADYVYAENFRNRPANTLTAGTLEVTGEFYCYTGDFTATGTHTVILSGTEDQSVVIDDNSIDFINLTIKNGDTRNINLSGFIGAETIDTEEKPLNIITDKGGICPSVLKCSELNVTGWFEFYNSNTDFKGGKLSIDGDLYLHGGIDLNGAEMTVTGDVNHDTGRLYVHGGTVKIMGTYSLENYETLFRYENGVLKMEHNTDYVYVGGEFKINTSMPLWPQLMSAGTLEIAGDFYSYSEHFQSKDSHKVILSGESDQTIFFNNQDACFNDLEIKNSDTRNIIIDGVFTVNSSVTCDGESLNIVTTNGSASFGSVKSNINITGDFGFYGSTNLQGDTVNIDGYLTTKGNLTVTGADVTVTGELTQTGGTLTVARGTLTLEDFYEQTGGTLYIKSGTLNAKEDCELNGIIKMDNQSGSAVFKKNFTHRKSSDNSITAGTLEFKGNVTVYESSFVTTGTSKTVLSGTEDQILYLEYFNAYDSTYHFNELVILNSDTRKIIIQREFDANNVSCDGTAANFVMDGGSMPGLKLDCDANVSGDIYLAYDAINLNGHKMTVDGSLYQRSGKIELGGGQLYVEDYIIETNEETASEATLDMTNSKDYICVNGDFLIDTTVNHSNYLTAGTLEIKGDFYQRYTDGSTYAFPASGTHRVLLSGDGAQNVTFDSYDDSHFNILELGQSEENYVFSDDPCWTELIPVGGTTTASTTITTTTTTTSTTDTTATETTVSATTTAVFSTETTTVSSVTTTTSTTVSSDEVRLIDIAENETVTVSADEQVCLTCSSGDEILTWISSQPEIIDIKKDGTVTIYSAGTVTLTAIDVSGDQYRVQFVAAESETMRGDVDGNGAVDISDATLVLTIYTKNAAGLPINEYTDNQKKTADVDGNSSVDINDATLILTYYVQNAVGLNPEWDKILA